MKKYAALFFVLILFASSLACGSSATPVVVSTAVPPSAKTQPPAATEQPIATEPPAPTTSPIKTYNVGDSVSIGDIIVTVNEVIFSTGDSNFKPDEGHQFIIIDVTVENKGTSSYSLSSMLQMSIKDDTGQKYDIDFKAFAVAGESSPDGEIAAGDKLRGRAGFQVPINATGLVFIFDNELFGEGQVRVSIPNK